MITSIFLVVGSWWLAIGLGANYQLPVARVFACLEAQTLQTHFNCYLERQVMRPLVRS